VSVDPPVTASKAAWRRWAKAVRAGLPPDLSLHLADALRRWPPYREARCVLTYLAFGGEPDLSALHQDAGKTFLVTRTHLNPPRLTLHRLEGGLERHPFGFLHPPPDAPEVALDEVDLALVPGLAFDLRGARLGYGKGLYDRLLPGLSAPVPRVGVTAAALIVPGLPHDALDVPMTHLLSEVGVREVTR
jgi:5-formyltetrahydrofolate cyclo-ligase